MNSKTIIPLVLGLGVGGFAIKIVVDVVKEAQGATQANMTPCVVAKTDIDFAAEVGADKLVVREWPKDSLPQQHFKSIEDLKDRVTSMYIPKDVPIYPSMLAPAGTPPGIQTRIKAGFRAVSVAIDEISGVAYQLKPGDKVDVISLVKRNRTDGSNDFVSRIILQNVEIAAVGRTLDSARGGQAPKSVARSVTLLLKQDQVTQLHLAQSNRGKISLALRGSLDPAEDVQVADGLDEPEDEPLPQPTEVFERLAQAPMNPQMPEPASWVVRVISGNDIRLVEYRNQQGRWVPADERAAGGQNLSPMMPQDFGSPDFVDHLDPDYGQGSQTAEE